MFSPIAHMENNITQVKVTLGSTILGSKIVRGMLIASNCLVCANKRVVPCYIFINVWC